MFSWLFDGELDSIEMPPAPAWGSLPLDIYLLVCPFAILSAHGKEVDHLQEEWNRIPPELSDETADQKRRRLVRQFLTLGDVGRLVRGDTCYLMTL